MLHSLPLRWCIALLIAGLAWVVYQPALGGRFILDDDLLLTGNDTIRAPDGLARIWFSTEPTDYWPVTNTSLWLEWRLWGASPNGYHVTNLLLHIVDCWLIWWVLAKLSIPGAPLGGDAICGASDQRRKCGVDRAAQKCAGAVVFSAGARLVFECRGSSETGELGK